MYLCTVLKSSMSPLSLNASHVLAGSSSVRGDQASLPRSVRCVSLCDSQPSVELVDLAEMTEMKDAGRRFLRLRWWTVLSSAPTSYAVSVDSIRQFGTNVTRDTTDPPAWGQLTRAHSDWRRPLERPEPRGKIAQGSKAAIFGKIKV